MSILSEVRLLNFLRLVLLLVEWSIPGPYPAGGQFYATRAYEKGEGMITRLKWWMYAQTYNMYVSCYWLFFFMHWLVAYSGIQVTGRFALLIKIVPRCSNRHHSWCIQVTQGSGQSVSHGSDTHTHTFTPTTWICTIMISTLIDTDRTCILYSLVPDASVCIFVFLI